MKTCSLYRHWDAAGVLLYVGIAACPFKRTQDHKRNARWFLRVSTITIEHFMTRDDAMRAERLAVVREKPLFNTMLQREFRAEWMTPGIVEVLTPETKTASADSMWETYCPACNGPATVRKVSKFKVVRVCKDFCQPGVVILDTWVRGKKLSRSSEQSRA